MTSRGTQTELFGRCDASTQVNECLLQLKTIFSKFYKKKFSTQKILKGSSSRWVPGIKKYKKGTYYYTRPPTISIGTQTMDPARSPKPTRKRSLLSLRTRRTAKKMKKLDEDIQKVRKEIDAIQEGIDLNIVEAQPPHLLSPPRRTTWMRSSRSWRQLGFRQIEKTSPSTRSKILISG